MGKIGILSDTHGLIRSEVIDALNGCDSIIHAGDIDQPKVITALREIAPVYAVRGNADKDEWTDDLPKSLSITLDGIRIYAIHNKKHIAEDLSDKNVVIYGHTHKYHEEYRNGQLWLNPGCCGYRKPSQPVTLALLKIAKNGAVSVQRIDIAASCNKPARNPEKESVLPKDIDKIIKKVIRAIKSGKSAEEIAGICGISNGLADLICRMYLTHPGIDMDGMIRRLEERM